MRMRANKPLNHGHPADQDCRTWSTRHGPHHATQAGRYTDDKGYGAHLLFVSVCTMTPMSQEWSFWMRSTSIHLSAMAICSR